MFETNKIYKFMVSKGYEANSIYTIKVGGEDDTFVWGIDLKGQQRGIKKQSIIDWIVMEDEKEVE
jgi:myo-inositol-1-phosphate synthase